MSLGRRSRTSGCSTPAQISFPKLLRLLLPVPIFRNGALQCAVLWHKQSQDSAAAAAAGQTGWAVLYAEQYFYAHAHNRACMAETIS